MTGQRHRRASPRKREVANGFDFSKGVRGLTRDEAALLRRRTKALGTMGPLFYDHPIHVVRGEGAHLFDAQGNDYLDCYNNVACVGHANPRVREAVADQLGRQDTHSRYLQDEVLDYAERLLGYVPSRLDHVCCTNSGSESNDLALRMARVFTGHRGVVVTANAYHGVTDLAASVSPSFGAAIPLAPFVQSVEVADVLTADLTVARATEMLVSRFREAFQRLRDAGFGVSAVLLDQIFSSDGVLPGARGWVGDVAAAVHAEGGLLICDEVQSGFARTGEAFWGFQRHRADADMLTVGKPMGNGIPAGAVIYPHAIGDAFAEVTRYFNTFGGNPVSMRAASAVLDEIESRGLLAHAKAMGDALSEEMNDIFADASSVGAIRHAGMFIGVDIVTPDETRAPDPVGARHAIARLRDEKVLISAAGATGASLKIRPPLVFDDADANRLLETLRRIVGTGVLE